VSTSKDIRTIFFNKSGIFYRPTEYLSAVIAKDSFLQLCGI